MKLAYADPPYEGQSKKHYGGVEVNHHQLIRTLEREYDGFALSLKSNSLATLLPMFNSSVRVCAWLKPYAVIKKNVNPYYSWEPVIIKAARKRGDKREYIADCIVCNPTFNSRIIGEKPLDFCVWVFELLGAEPGDDFEDLFPGSGSVSESWDYWKRQKRLGLVY